MPVEASQRLTVVSYRVYVGIVCKLAANDRRSVGLVTPRNAVGRTQVTVSANRIARAAERIGDVFKEAVLVAMIPFGGLESMSCENDQKKSAYSSRTSMWYRCSSSTGTHR